MWWLKFTNGNVWLSGNDFSVILAGYLLGCFTTGYYLVRFRTGEDIRRQGSGSVGARNVGRLLGPLGFFITLCFDLAKGALIVEVANHFGLGSWAMMLAIWAVVAGHIWPVQLRVRGGKGIATSLGALLLYDGTLILSMAVICLIALALIRRFTLSGLLAFAVSPVVVFACDRGMTEQVGISVLAILILIAHRKNIREEIDRILLHSEMKEKQSHPH